MDPSIDARGDQQVPDEVLTRQARLGDREAFTLLVTRHGPGLYRFVRRLVRTTADAEDCTQDVVISAWRGITSFRQDASFRTWLYVLARRQALKTVGASEGTTSSERVGGADRAGAPSSGATCGAGGDDSSGGVTATTSSSPGGHPAGRRSVVSLETVGGDVRDAHSGPEAENIEEGLLTALDAALALLPERQRSVWLLREVDGLSYSQIGTVVDQPASTVRGLLERARSTVAAAMQAWR